MEEKETLGRLLINSVFGAVAALSLTIIPNGLTDLFGWRFSRLESAIYGLVVVAVVCFAVVYARPDRSLWYGVTISSIYALISIVVFHGESITGVLEVGVSPLLLPEIFLLAIAPIAVAGLIGANLGRRFRGIRGLS